MGQLEQGYFAPGGEGRGNVDGHGSSARGGGKLQGRACFGRSVTDGVKLGKGVRARGSHLKLKIAARGGLRHDESCPGAEDGRTVQMLASCAGHINSADRAIESGESRANLGDEQAVTENQARDVLRGHSGGEAAKAGEAEGDAKHEETPYRRPRMDEAVVPVARTLETSIGRKVPAPTETKVTDTESSRIRTARLPDPPMYKLRTP